jgi:serine/threonine protein kinase
LLTIPSAWRFQREAEVLASLDHPNIAQIYGVEERALVMELVEGESPKGPMPSDEAWKITSQMAAGLEYAHEKGIVHRDLKPANVKVTADGGAFPLTRLCQNGPRRQGSASPRKTGAALTTAVRSEKRFH